MLENQFAYGFVIGMLVSSEGDSSDTGKYPDALPINTTITFTRVRGQYKKELSLPENGAKAMLVSHKPVIAGVESNGFITGDMDPIRKIPISGATPGVWLVEGRYKVNISGLMSEFEIEVTPEHTPESPLDLADWINYSAPPGSTVKVVSIPVGEDGQLMQWYQGEIVWREPTILQGPPNTLSIGTVESTSETAYATVSGDSPNQVLSLGLPKGAKGDQGVQGPPGAVASSGTYLIVGPGRPDTPATTGGIITGNEPVGAEYRSTDGANVGAWVWMKRPTGWVVVNGDTGWRMLSDPTVVPASVYIRRKNDSVEVFAIFPSHGGTITRTANTEYKILSAPGFRPKLLSPAGQRSMSGLTSDMYQRTNNLTSPAGRMNVSCDTGDASFWGHIFVKDLTPTQFGGANVVFTTSETWPTTLPGTAT